MANLHEELFLKNRMKTFSMFLLNFNQDILRLRAFLSAHSYTFGLHLQNSLPRGMPEKPARKGDNY